MTHILLVVDAQFVALYWEDDVRSPRELVAAINRGELRIGDTYFSTLTPQSACAISEQNAVVVTYTQPVFELAPRLYQVLWALADGKTAEMIAEALGISVRTVYLHFGRLKECFDVYTLDEVLDQAEEFGLI